MVGKYEPALKTARSIGPSAASIARAGRKAHGRLVGDVELERGDPPRDFGRSVASFRAVVLLV